MAIKLWDLAGAEDDRRFSPNCWRVKMALRHKRLEQFGADRNGARAVSPIRLLEPDDPVYAWRERVMDLFGGYARQAKGYPVWA